MSVVFVKSCIATSCYKAYGSSNSAACDAEQGKPAIQHVYDRNERAMTAVWQKKCLACC